MAEWQGTAVFQTPVFSSGTGSIKVNSTATGTAYLVKSDVTVTDVTSITSQADDHWNAVAISTPTTLLSTENFATATTGWTSTAVAGSVASPGSLAGSSITDHFLGQFYDTTGNEVVSRQYNFGVANANKTVQIEFDMYEFGTWDNELFKVYVSNASGTDVLQTAQAYAVDTYNGGANGYATGAWDGGVKLGDLSGLGGGNNDEMHHYVLQGTTDSTGKLKLGFGSNLNDGMANESWGIDNVVLTTTAASTSLSLAGLSAGTYYLYTANSAGVLSSPQTTDQYQLQHQAVIIA